MNNLLDRFVANHHRAARELLAARGMAGRPVHGLHAEWCPVHGPVCARVTFGVFREYFDESRASRLRLPPPCWRRYCRVRPTRVSRG